MRKTERWTWELDGRQVELAILGLIEDLPEGPDWEVVVRVQPFSLEDGGRVVYPATVTATRRGEAE